MSDRTRRQEIAAVCAAASLFAVAFSMPLLRHLDVVYSIYDWDRFRDIDWAAVNIVRDFHQLPIWSPYQCGGTQLLANVESRILTPFFLLHVVFGSAVGINLEVPIHIAIAWAGGYVLGRVLGLGTLGSVGCATVFPSSTWLYLHFGAGHLHFLPFAFSPWIVAFTFLGIERRRLAWSAAIGALMALAFFAGGVYPVTDTGLLIAILSLILAIQQRSFWPLIVCLCAAFFAVGFAAPKILPMLATGQSRGTSADEEWMWLSEYAALLFSRDQNVYRWLVWCGVGSMPFCMLGAYMSPAFVVLGILGTYSNVRRALPWLILIFVFFILGMGNYFGPIYSPWVILHHLPVFSWLRVVPRYFIMLVLCLSVLTGFGLDMLAHQRTIFMVVGVALLAGGTIDGYLIGPSNLVVQGDAPAPLPKSPVFRQYEDANDLQTVRVNSANMGITNCSAQMTTRDVVSASNKPGYRGAQYLLGPGSLALVRWTPEILTYDVEAKSPTVLVINQNCQ
jgi:hypothetical protein